jgi:mevalonate kinase
MTRLNKSIFVSAPCRISFFGEHVDYLSGPALVCTIDNFRTFVEIKNSPTERFTFFSKNFNEVVKVKKDDLSKYNSTWSDFLKASILVIENTYDVQISPLSIKINSVLPISSGLSSSAALAVSTIAGLSAFLKLNIPPEKIAHLAYVVEHDMLKIACGQMDQYVCAIGGMVYLNCKETPIKEIQKYKPTKNMRVVIGNTKIPKNTGEIVKEILLKQRNNDPGVQSFIETVEYLISRARQHLGTHQEALDLRYLGSLLNVCQYSMKNDVNISNDFLDNLCSCALESGAYGAKISGAGKGGCMIALCSIEGLDKIAKSLENMGAEVYVGNFSEDGIKTENKKSFQGSLSRSYKLS